MMGGWLLPSVDEIMKKSSCSEITFFVMSYSSLYKIQSPTLKVECKGGSFEKSRRAKFGTVFHRTFFGPDLIVGF